MSQTTIPAANAPTDMSKLRLVQIIGTQQLHIPAEQLGLLGNIGAAVAGDMIYASADGTWTRLAKGTALQHLRINSGATAPEWASYATIESLEGLSLAQGDLLYATAADTLQRLPKGTAGQLLQMNAGATAPEWTTPASGLEVGTVFDYAGTSAPAKYLMLYGQNVSRTTYAALFAVLGTTYGAGDGSTTFGLPDLRGRVVAGKDDMGGTSANRLTGLSGGVDGDVLGGAGGSETHALTSGQNGPHTHTVPNNVNSSFGSTANSTTRATTTSANSQTTNSSGNGDPHNNVQPTLILNKIIYAGV